MHFQPRVLVVDDDPGVVAVLEKALESHKIEVDEAHTGTEAMRKFVSHSYDLVICDYQLPDTDGCELMSKMRRIHPELDLIMMSGQLIEDAMLKAFDIGIADFLLKPFSHGQEVAEKVWRALQKRKVRLENERLLGYLRQASTQIEEMNRSLEQQVKERTAQLEEANKRLEEMTLVDEVTGLYNQRYLYARLAEEISRSRRYEHELSVIMIDIDNFKKVNDSHDHIFGSRVLKRVGTLMRKHLRDSDRTVRYGGDEFTILLPHTNAEGAALVAERLRGHIEAANFGDDDEIFKVTASFGIAKYDASAHQSAKDLLRAADRALYAAKNKGRNTVAVDGVDTSAADKPASKADPKARA